MKKKTKPLYSYKLYLTGEDAERTPTLLAHYVYDVPNVETAKRQAAKDEKFIRILHKYRLSPKTVKYDAIFRVDEAGVVIDTDKEAAFRLTFAQGLQS